MLGVIMLCLSHYAGCYYAERHRLVYYAGCYYAECRKAECREIQIEN
jgi:hypothetical protein